MCTDGQTETGLRVLHADGKGGWHFTVTPLTQARP